MQKKICSCLYSLKINYATVFFQEYIFQRELFLDKGQMAENLNSNTACLYRQWRKIVFYSATNSLGGNT